MNNMLSESQKMQILRRLLEANDIPVEDELDEGLWDKVKDSMSGAGGAAWKKAKGLGKGVMNIVGNKDPRLLKKDIAPLIDRFFSPDKEYAKYASDEYKLDTDKLLDAILETKVSEVIAMGTGAKVSKSKKEKPKEKEDKGKRDRNEKNRRGGFGGGGGGRGGRGGGRGGGGGGFGGGGGGGGRGRGGGGGGGDYDDDLESDGDSVQYEDKSALQIVLDNPEKINRLIKQGLVRLEIYQN